MDLHKKLCNPPNPLAMSGGPGPPPPSNTSPDAAAQFAQMPKNPSGGGPGGPPGALQKPVPGLPKPGGPGQGISGPLKPTAGKRKEYFGLGESDYKSTIVVFALVLIFSSSIFFDFLKRYIPLIASAEGKVTLVGSLISALLAAIIYLVIKIVAKI